MTLQSLLARPSVAFFIISLHSIHRARTNNLIPHLQPRRHKDLRPKHSKAHMRDKEGKSQQQQGQQPPSPPCLTHSLDAVTSTSHRKKGKKNWEVSLSGSKACFLSSSRGEEGAPIPSPQHGKCCSLQVPLTQHKSPRFAPQATSPLKSSPQKSFTFRETDPPTGG